MRRAQALAVRPRSLGRYISTAPLAPAPARPAAASPFRRPAPPSSLLSQSRSESGDSQPRLEDEDPQPKLEDEDPQPKLEDEDVPVESEARDSWSKLEVEAFRNRPDLRHSWSRNHPSHDIAREVRDAAVQVMRVKERTRVSKRRPEPRPDIQTYLFSDHVLDLAAEDAPGVRLYDEADRELWNEKWSAPSAVDVAARERILSHVESANDAANAFKYVKKYRDLRYLRIRDPDILSLALRGGPGRPTTSQESQPLGAVRRATSDLLHRNGIPRVTWGDDATVLWWMEGRVAQTAPHNLKIPSHHDPEFAFRHGRFDYGEFRRILSIALASGKGFAGPTLDLQKQIAVLCRDGPDKPAELNSSYSTLAFVMDVHRAIRMGQDKLRLPLIRIAIEHAAGGLYVDVAHDYLKLAQLAISDTADHYNPPDVARLVSEGLARALNRLAVNIEAAATPGIGGHFPTRTSLIKLLTGFGSDRVEAPSCFMKFMGHMQTRHIAMQPYIGNLARLGALRSVWLLWRATTRKHYGDMEGRGPQTIDVFSRALLNAKDVIRAYRVKNSRTPDSPGDASRMDCFSLPDDITKRTQSAVADVASVELSPEIPFQIAAALEMETPEDAIRKLKEVMDGVMVQEEEPVEEEPETPEDGDGTDSWKLLQASSRQQQKRK